MVDEAPRLRSECDVHIPVINGGDVIKPFWTLKNKTRNRKYSDSGPQTVSGVSVKRRLRRELIEPDDSNQARLALGLRVPRPRLDKGATAVAVNRAVEIMATTPSMSAPEALREAGLTPAQSLKPAIRGEVINKLKSALLGAGVDEEKIAVAFRDGLSATKMTRHYDKMGVMCGEHEDPDHHARFKFAREAADIIEPRVAVSPSKTWLDIVQE